MNKAAKKEYDRIHNQLPSVKIRREAIRSVRQAEWTAWHLQRKAKLGCSRCPEHHPYCLDYHHKVPAEKSFEISDAVASTMSKDRILLEIAKCELICANCHRKEHWSWEL